MSSNRKGEAGLEGHRVPRDGESLRVVLAFVPLEPCNSCQETDMTLLRQKSLARDVRFGIRPLLHALSKQRSHPVLFSQGHLTQNTTIARI